MTEHIIKELNREYTKSKDSPSDIYQHINTLRKYASECDTVIEAGVRNGQSTWGILKGMSDDTNRIGHKKLTSIDIQRTQSIDKIESVASGVGINYNFVEINDLDFVIEEDVDMCFIDTWHIYGHLKRELEKFSRHTKKYILLHDTTVDEYVGESVRTNGDIRKQMKETGYSFIEIYAGLWPAVVEFLDNHPEFILERRYTNCNGLTVLKRV